MFWDDTPFEARARFMRDNVMELSEEFVRACDPDQLDGLCQFRELLLEIFAEPEAFEGADALERFHTLTYSTQIFFQAAAMAGATVEEGKTLRVEKAAFKKAYKKPGSAPFEILPRFGVSFTYLKKENPADSYAACDAFLLRFPQREGIAAALIRMAARFAQVDMKREYAEALVMLCKADYDRLILGRPALREAINPLRPDIVRATGDGAPLYQAVVRRAAELGLKTSASIQRYANPTWNINFLHGKKLRLKTIWCEGRNFVHVPIPFAHAEAVIRGREGMPPRVRAAIERFGCVNCGRCKKQTDVQFLRVDNITVCDGHGESSTVFLSFESPDEIDAVFDVMGRWAGL